MDEYILEMKNISKEFGGICALNDVTLRLKKGEVLCLCGENGAGKSTLMKILTGVIQPTKGEIFISGEKISINKPVDAFRLGISIVHQELIQIPDMTVAENIFVGRYNKKFGCIDFRALKKNTQVLMDRLGIHYNPSAKIRQFSIAQRQLIEIMKALSYDSKIIVLDEPTASLTLDETKLLYKVIDKLRQDGVSIIFISHRMEDIFTVGNRLLVLKDGCYSGDANVGDVSVDDIIRMMIGRDLGQQFVSKTNTPGEVILELRNITNENVNNISFSVRKGEVLGLGGLIGAGRTELLRAIYGVDPYEGEILYQGKRLKNKSPSEAIASGIGMVPEDRKDLGLVLIHSIANNILMPVLGRVSKFGMINCKKATSIAVRLKNDLNIKTPNIGWKASMLSGGNQQKVVLGKCLAAEPSIILLDEPTRGVDVGAKAEIYKIINDLTTSGHTIIMVSSELSELLGVSDRIIVMHEGNMSGELDAKDATEEKVMKLAIA